MMENRTAIKGKQEELPSNLIRWSREWLHARLGYAPTNAFAERVATEIQRYGSVIVIIPREEQHD